MRFLTTTALVLLLLATSAAAQSSEPNPVERTTSEDRMQSFDQRKALIGSSLVKNVPFRNVGPTVMSGRVVDIDARPDDPSHFYVAYASGGLWFTDNNGTTFEPVFDNQASMTIGDIAVDWEAGTIWVGTGENNSSRSSYAGTGVYRSTDGGQTWEHRGLPDTQRIGRIILHPSNPNTVWVAAIGSLYSPSASRGVYKTSNGGETWEKTLFVDENTGAIDLVRHPVDPQTLLAATWHRERRAWNFVESGSGSGVYRSTDGGSTWDLISTEDSGFPQGSGVGRIGLAMFPDNPSILYALVDNQDRRPDDDPEDDEPVLTRDALRAMTSQAFLALPDSVISTYLSDNRFPQRYDVDTVRGMVEDATIEPVALVEYVEDANQLLFDTPVIGAEVYRSDDAGATWSRTHEGYLDQVYNSYGYYFGEVRVSPFDPDRIYVLGVPLIASSDGGVTFESVGGANVHADHQAMWLSPLRDGHIIDGNDGGLNISYDAGESWIKANSPSVGQFYAIQVDDADPYNVYGGLQDNGTWFGPSTYSAGPRWHSSGRYPYRGIGGGDGMQVEVDTRDNATVYSGSQFGFYSRQHLRDGDRASTRPRHELGERPLRFNWQTPIHLSRHNQDIFYIGANRLYRSLNKGSDLEPISGDLTNGGQKGDVPYGTLTTIDESPLKFGLLYVGSDDGLVHVSPDGGVSWQRISDSLPQDLWVSRVEASAHEESRLYVGLNGYRWDNFEAHVYMSDDLGASWTRLGYGGDASLPNEPVNVVLEDPNHEEIVYVGTDHGVYVSLDSGSSFHAMQGGLPDAPVHDLKIQSTANELVVGTHGRSIYIASLDHLHALVKSRSVEGVEVYEPEAVTWSDRWGTRTTIWRDYFEPEVAIVFFSDVPGSATFEVSDADGRVLARRSFDAERGLNYFDYDLAIDVDLLPTGRRARGFVRPEEADNGQTYLAAGTYTTTIRIGDGEGAASLELRTREQR